MSTRDFSTFLRFILAGVVNTAFGWVIYSICILVGLQPWFALIFSTIIGIVFNFFSTGGYAFRDKALKRLPRFIGCYILLYGVNMLAISTIDRWVKSPIWAQAILTAPMAVLSYFLLSRFVFVSRSLIQTGDL